jgi:MFS family permease
VGNHPAYQRTATGNGRKGGRPEMTPTGIDYIKQSLPKSVLRTGIILTVIGLVFAIPAYMVDPVRSTFNCLIIFAFLTSIGIGSLFLVALEYLAGAVWSVPFRRVSEFLSVTMFIAPIFAIPVLLNIGSIFSWTHPDIVAASDNLRFKAPYLDQNFFIIRTVAIFIIWFIFYFLLTRNSNKQDKSGNQALTKRNIIISAVFMPVFGISLSVIAIDWLMSLAPKWYSTIFAVYYFSGTFLAAFALLTYISVKMDKSELLVKGLGRDHYYNFGAMLFAFINFWAYIAFSQYMLIWYGNLPEETGWFLDRWVELCIYRINSRAIRYSLYRSFITTIKIEQKKFEICGVMDSFRSLLRPILDHYANL